MSGVIHSFKCTSCLVVKPEKEFYETMLTQCKVCKRLWSMINKCAKKDGFGDQLALFKEFHHESKRDLLEQFRERARFGMTGRSISFARCPCRRHFAGRAPIRDLRGVLAFTMISLFG